MALTSANPFVRPRAAALAVAVAASLLVASSDARAQTPDLTTRRMLIEQGQQASQAGNHTLALQRAEQAMAIQVTPSLRLFYARELQHATRPADAFAQAEECVHEADRDATVPNRDALMESCRAIAQQTRGEIGLLTVTINGTRPADTRVTIGGRALSDALIGSPSAVNPGRVIVEASAHGYRTTRREIDVPRGGNEAIALELEQDPHVPVGSGAGGLEGPDPVQRPNTRTRPVSVGAIVVTAVGGLFLSTAPVFYVLRQSGFGPCSVVDGSAVCPTRSDAVNLSLNAGTMETMNALTNAALISGTIILSGGVAWLVADRVTAREQIVSRARTTTRLAFAADARGASVIVGGAW